MVSSMKPELNSEIFGLNNVHDIFKSKDLTVDYVHKLTWVDSRSYRSNVVNCTKMTMLFYDNATMIYGRL